MVCPHVLSTLTYATTRACILEEVASYIYTSGVFRSGPTFRSMLTKVKDPLPVEKHANVVYEVPCSCGKVYIGETKRRLETRLKEHKEACVKGQTTKSAIAEHAWSEGHPINWDGTRILQRASHTMELVLKEAMCIQSTPTDSWFNRDSGYELPDCWIALNRKLKGGAPTTPAPGARAALRNYTRQAVTSRPRPASCSYKLVSLVASLHSHPEDG